jgi:hypothetical protein
MNTFQGESNQHKIEDSIVPLFESEIPTHRVHVVKAFPSWRLLGGDQIVQAVTSSVPSIDELVLSEWACKRRGLVTGSR